MEEALSIIRSIDRAIDGVFASFEDPGKIGLAGFMEKNYMFNMPLDKFGYLFHTHLKRNLAMLRWRRPNNPMPVLFIPG